MKTWKLKISALFSILWILILAVTLTTATYAWFTVNAVTNVEPMEQAVSRGDANLLISDSRSGPFDRECKLRLTGTTEELKPLSTADLSQFFQASAQDRNGISTLFRQVKEPDSRALHGTVYLQCKYRGCDVYLKKTGLDFGVDGQMLSALRLGLKISTENKSETLIFRMDELGNTGGAASTVTVSEQGSVVSSADSSGKASFVKDPSVSMSDYLAVEGGEDEEPKAGVRPLCSLKADEIAEVEFWMYLEGCDDNCVNEVQKRNASLQLSFAGVPEEEDT